MKTWIFWIGAVIDLIGVGVALYFMLSDMLKGTSGTNNPTMFGLTFLVAALIIGAFCLKYADKIVFANVLLWIPATPLALYGLFILLFIILKPDMR